RLVGKRFFNIDLHSSVELNVTLDFGAVISGFVTDTLGFPVGDVDLDVDTIGAGRVYTPRDETDLITGAYWIVVPPALYRVRFEPPPGVRLRGIKIDSVNIVNDTSINVTLPGGLFLTGIVTDEFGVGLKGISIGLRDTLTRADLFVANDKTDSLGVYNVVVPSGVFTLQFAPPLGSRFVGSRIDRVMFSSDTVIIQSLKSGVLVTIIVQDEDGIPIRGVDLDFTLESTRIRQYTPNDNTGVDGTTTVAILPDIYEIKADPPAGTILDRTVFRNVSIQSDTTITIVLKIQKYNLLGQIIDAFGIGLPKIDIVAFESSGPIPTTVRSKSTDATGAFSFGVPVNTTSILVASHRGGRYVGKLFTNIAIRSDTIWSPIALDTGVIVHAFIVDEFLNPAQGYKLILTNPLSGLAIPSAHDTVDRLGTVDITAPVGVYDLSVNSPTPILSVSLTIPDFNLTSDTSIILRLGGSSPTIPNQFSLKQNYPNPFNGGTKIPYLLLEDTEIEINIYNALGQKVKRITNGIQPAGYYEAIWEGDNDDGRPVASGVYFYSLSAARNTVSRTMLIIR
ncbi:MAG: T9SS type A sorting domain-containing protein, partial [candidate division Zixibacteria bacterium]|nr:T9SS type A sorting domain-containing protein [candidate division Zixibacteria bacterium]